MTRSLTFTLAATLLAAGCAAELELDSSGDDETLWAIVDGPSGPRHMAYLVEDGLAIAEGDIVLGTVEEVEAATAEAQLWGAGRRSSSYRWPNGVIPYDIDSAFNSDERAGIYLGMLQWSLQTQYRFRVKTSTDPDWVYFLRDTVNGSPVGRQTGIQYIRLAEAEIPGKVMHEIGHAMGLFHEHMRADRDTYVNVHKANIQPGKEKNFEIWSDLDNPDGRDLFRYDFDSITHYPDDAFGIGDLKTMTRDDGQPLVAQRDHLSDGDITSAMRLLTYSEGQRTYSVSSDATFRCLDVQGASYSRGAPINNFTCHGGDNQLWFWWYMPSNGAHLLINKKSGMCLDYRTLASGTRLEQRPCDGSVPQRWNLSSPTIRPVSSSSWCVQARTDWTSTIEPCDGGTDQRWSFTY